MDAASARADEPLEAWVDFFDDTYRDIYGELLHPVRTETEVASAVNLLALREGERVLDLCCGDGRHAVPLQRRGLRVTGVDLAAPMIRAAKRRADRVLNEEDPQPVFLRADAARLPLRPAFDAVLLLYNSISFGPRAMTEALLRGARAALRAGGRMLVECTHRDHEAIATARGDERESLTAAAGRLAGAKISIRRQFDPVAGEQHAWMTVELPSGERRERHLRYLVYTAGELLEMLRAAGFVKRELLGGYDGRAFGVETPAVVIAGT